MQHQKHHITKPELVKKKTDWLGATLVTSRDYHRRNNPEFPLHPTHVATRNLFAKQDPHRSLTRFSFKVVALTWTYDIQAVQQVVKRGFDLKGCCSEAVLGKQVKYGEIPLPIPLARCSQRHTTQPTLISPTRNPTRESNKGFDWSNGAQPARWPIKLIERNSLS